MLERKTETIEHIQNIGSACKVTRKYEIAEGTSNFLDAWDADELFSQNITTHNRIILCIVQKRKSFLPACFAAQ